MVRTYCYYVSDLYSKGMTQPIQLSDNTYEPLPGNPMGPCQLQASPLCTGQAQMERLDPMAMAPVDPAPASVIPTCRECFGRRSDEYLAAVAR